MTGDAMAKPDTIMVDGRCHSWRQLCELRRHQMEARQAAQPKQLTLFELKDDCRPASERSAATRYAEPSLLNLMREL